MSRALLLAVLLAGCSHARPTVAGRDLYAQVQTLQAAGQVTIGSIVVRRDQTLVTTSSRQPFGVAQLVERCRGGDPALDVDCTLALLVAEHFTVHDHPPTAREVRSAAREDRSGSALASIAVVGLAVAATGGLVYGVATCEFPGCKAVFGVPLVLIGGAALFLLGRD